MKTIADDQQNWPQRNPPALTPRAAISQNPRVVLDRDTFHAWVDGLRVSGVEVIEDVPEIRIGKPKSRLRKFWLWLTS